MKRQRGIALGVIALAVVAPVAGAANFVFHAIASRALGPDGYGGLNALLALTIAVAVPAAAIQMTLARSLLSGAASALLMRRSAAKGAAIVAVVTISAAPVIAGALHLDTPMPVVALVGYLTATIVGLVPRAVLVAQDRLGMLAAGTLVGVAVRLTLGFLWVGSGGDLTAAVAAGSVAEIVATGFLLWATRFAYTAEASPAASWRAHVGPVLAFGCLWGLLAVDSVASRAVMPGTAAGAYSAAAVLARAILFLPQSVATAAFARLANPVTRPRALAWSTAAALTLAVGGVCGLALFGTTAMAVLFGDGYTADLRVLTVLGAGAAVMAVVNVWVHARVAYGQPAGLRMATALVVAAVGAGPAAAMGAATLAWWMTGAALLALWLVRPRSAVAAPFPDPNCVPPGGELDVSIVLPVYNAAGRVGAHLVAVEQMLAASGRSFEVIVVDDGSTDTSAAEADAAAGPATRVVRVAHGGKGSALMAGLSSARGRLVGFIDGDGDIPASVVGDLIDAAIIDGRAGAIAVKGDVASRGLLRRSATIGYRLVVRATVAVDVSDTQTGAKVFRRDTVAAVLPWVSEAGFAWDVEFLAAARRLGFRSFAEVPVEVARSQSSIRPSAVWAMLRATIRVASRVAMLPGYDPAETPGAVEPRIGEGPHPAVPSRVMSRPDRPLRILVLNWKCHRHPAAGGAEVYTHEVAKRWAAAGHTVTVFAPETAGAPPVEQVDGYTVHRRGNRLSVYRQARRFWYERRDDFDVIVDEVNTRPFEAPLWADVPVVAVFHQLARDVWFHELPVPVAAAGRYVLEPAWIRAYHDVPVATISDSSAASLRHAGLGRVINVGVGGSMPAEMLASTKSKVPSIAFVGRMVSAKRPLDALAAFEHARRELGEGEFVLIGDGPIADQVRRAAGPVPGARFMGHVSEAEKFSLLGRAHVLVATSVREGWGLVVDEAAAVGTYPIGYRVPGLVDSIPAAGGTLVDPNPRALAAALVEHLPRLVQHPAVLRRGGASTWDDVAERLLAVVATAARPLERV